MPWFAAHSIFYFRLKHSAQSAFSVQENVFLIDASTSEDAYVAAESRARENEGDAGGTLTWGDAPAELVFVGIRKLVSVSHRSDTNTLGSDDEITYSEFSVPSLEAVHRLAAGGSVSLVYEDGAA